MTIECNFTICKDKLQLDYDEIVNDVFFYLLFYAILTIFLDSLRHRRRYSILFNTIFLDGFLLVNVLTQDRFRAPSSCLLATGSLTTPRTFWLPEATIPHKGMFANEKRLFRVQQQNQGSDSSRKLYFNKWYLHILIWYTDHKTRYYFMHFWKFLKTEKFWTYTLYS